MAILWDYPALLIPALVKQKPEYNRGLQVGFRPDFTKNIAFGLSLPDGRFNDGEVDGWERPLPVDKWHQIHEANYQVYISYDMARAGRVYREIQQTPTNAQV